MAEHVYVTSSLCPLHRSYEPLCNTCRMWRPRRLNLMVYGDGDGTYSFLGRDVNPESVYAGPTQTVDDLDAEGNAFITVSLKRRTEV